MKLRRVIKLKKQYFSMHNGNPFDSKSLCTSEIVKSANKFAVKNDVIILEVKEPYWASCRNCLHIYKGF